MRWDEDRGRIWRDEMRWDGMGLTRRSGLRSAYRSYAGRSGRLRGDSAYGYFCQSRLDLAELLLGQVVKVYAVDLGSEGRMELLDRGLVWRLVDESGHLELQDSRSSSTKA